MIIKKWLSLILSNYI